MPPPSAVSATPVLVVRFVHATGLPLDMPMQCVISAATTVKKSPLPLAGLPAGASPENSLVMLPRNSLDSNGVGSMNQPLVSFTSALPLPAPMVIAPPLGLPPSSVLNDALAPKPPPDAPMLNCRL